MSAPTNVMQELHHCLARVTARPADPRALRDVTALVQRIEQIRTALGAKAPRMLRLYLERRSYAKALDLLDGRGGAPKPAI